ncbi:hypothetical protein XBFFL1_2410015 [Xenorhabdus bovienii str. feltiae Florida]|uniref:Uncharacterized protein n=1 Tax=Xenorhabdus bovienii str. oregonense TaxID=1398202 RepID=A0A077P5I9_XENBV|nr:hypothetical protein XBFFR1_2040010 [Xenorhabdus bovienii str. feltiae France]CDG93161.1 hypothetical protein XBFFL1_2410015 [Xenorhabdus bovienii str. feltiae Florida]CDH06074.1 hypothetical protein XBO1_2110077 [Xenorhabdus bovienii str. oregonense]
MMKPMTLKQYQLLKLAHQLILSASLIKIGQKLQCSAEFQYRSYLNMIMNGRTES